MPIHIQDDMVGLVQDKPRFSQPKEGKGTLRYISYNLNKDDILVFVFII